MIFAQNPSKTALIVASTGVLITRAPENATMTSKTMFKSLEDSLVSTSIAKAASQLSSSATRSPAVADVLTGIDASTSLGPGSDGFEKPPHLAASSCSDAPVCSPILVRKTSPKIHRVCPRNQI